MADFPIESQRSKAFFHSLSKTITEATQLPSNAKYKSGHNANMSDIQGEPVDYALNETEADNFVTNNPTIVKKYTEYALTEVAGSNGQAWYIEDGGQFMRPWIDPTDIPESTTAEPSYGYQAKLYTQAGAFVPPTTGAWNVDSFSGLVIFAPGFTPADMGWGNPKITAYVYIGDSLQEALSTILGGLSYKGTWDANSNTPAIPTASPSNNGQYYIVNVAGSTNIDGETDWDVNDWILSNGVTWSKIDQSGAEKVTLLNITGDISSGTPFDITASGVNYTKSKDSGYFGTTLSYFLDTNRIQIYRNGINLIKNVDATYVSATQFSLTEDVYAGEVIKIFS